jgi:hypothetical protein
MKAVVNSEVGELTLIAPVLRRVNALIILGPLQHETIGRFNGGVDMAESVSRKKRSRFDLIETWGRIMTLCFVPVRATDKKRLGRRLK